MDADPHHRFLDSPYGEVWLFFQNETGKPVFFCTHFLNGKNTKTAENVLKKYKK